MKLFLDTANVDEIKQGYSMGVIDGVTTNPTLIAREGKIFLETLKEICSIVEGPVNAEVVSLKADGMVKEAEKLAKINKNIVIKIPLIVEGLKAVKNLKKIGIRTNMTLCFSPNQALMAAKAGADYVSPFIGRLDDISHVGMDLIRTIKKIYNNYGYKTEVIVASIRNPLHVVDAALAGADIATVPFSVIEKLIKHPLTDIGLKKFLADWEKVPKER